MTEARPEVIAGRLRKKIKRLTQQRDHWQEEHRKLRDVLDLVPYYERRYRNMKEWEAEQKRVKGLEQRCNEQALLIEKLTKEA